MNQTQTIIKSFEIYLIQLGYSSGTCRMLPRLVQSFFHHNGDLFIHRVTQQDIIKFYDDLFIRPHQRREGGLSEIHINHHVYALKVFFNWLEVTRQIQMNPISALNFKKPEYKMRQPLSKNAIHELFEAAQNIRERIILHLFYSCGLRRAEAVQLDIKDVHFKTRLVYVRAGKGAKRRVVPVTEKVKAEMEEYYLCERTSQKKQQDPEPFIVNQYGKRLQGNDYYKLLKRILARTTVDQQTSLHHLRHSIATHLLENGLRSEFVRDFLGHTYLESTQIYVKVNKKLLSKL